MIDLYSFRTSNGRKASIMLEECGLDCALHIVDITAGEQDLPAFRAVNPNGCIRAIVDADGPDGAPLALFESGAIVLYLAQKTGLFLPEDEKDCWIATQWLLSSAKKVIGSMVYKVLCVTLCQNVSHPRVTDYPAILREGLADSSRASTISKRSVGASGACTAALS